MAQYPPDEADQSGKLKTLYMFKGEKGSYATWAYDVRAYLRGLGIDHHLLTDDSVPCPDVDGGNGDVKTKRTANRAAVHAYLNSIIQGEAKSHIAEDEFLQRPKLVWDTLKAIYGYVSAAKLDALMLEFNSFTMRKGEGIEHLYTRLLKLVKDIKDQD